MLAQKNNDEKDQQQILFKIQTYIIGLTDNKKGQFEEN